MKKLLMDPWHEEMHKAIDKKVAYAVISFGFFVYWHINVRGLFNA